MIKTLAFLSGLAAVSLGGLLRDGSGRQFLPSDITGEYNRFVKQGTCAKTVNITSFSSLAPGAYAVPHAKIYEDGYACTGDDIFTIVTKDAIIKSGNQFILETAPEPLATVVNALESQGATFMLGYENVDRVCGPSITTANSIAIFVEEEKKIEIPGLITLYPGAKYMIVYEPTSPTPCTYFSKFADTVIGLPPTGTVTPTAVPVTPEPVEEVIEPSAEPADQVVEREPVVIGAEPSAEASDSDDVGVVPPIVAPVAAPAVTPVADSSDSSSTASGGAVVVDEVLEDEELFVSSEPEPSFSPEGEDDGSVCFPASATVELENGAVKRMDEVQLGDRVKVGAGKFSPVFMFTHKNGGVGYSFVRLATESGETLSLTKGHYLYVNGQLAAAKTVRLGDSLRTEGGLTTVSEISTVSGRGLYNPQTVDGDIIVNGVVASTYTTAVEARTAHSLLLPVRALFGWTGIGTSVFDNGADALAGFMPSGNVVA